MSPSPSRTNGLRFWQSIEAFTPQAIPKPSRSRGELPYVAEYGAESVLPWLDPVWPQAPERSTWEHRVYVGTFDLPSAWAVLPTELGPTIETPRPVQSAVFTMLVRADGSVVPDSWIPSQCAWASGRFASSGDIRDVCVGFEEFAHRWKQTIAGLIVSLGISTGTESHEGARTGAMGMSELGKLLTRSIPEQMCAHLSLAGGSIGLRVESRLVPLREKPGQEEDAAATDYLNSFFSADLQIIAADLSDHPSVAAYLGERAPTERIDVRTDLEAVFEAVAPAFMPAGRWPSAPDHALSLSQQLAVNQSLLELSTRDGVFGINGPPGTGKTTLLRDLVAALVTDRAVALNAFVRPSDAFVQSSSWLSRSEKRRTVHRLHESVRGREMFVASSNNGAVENVSLEIPAASAIDESFRGFTSDPFAEIATLLLGASGPSDADPVAWSAIAGRLGKATNRSAFAQTLGFGRAASKKHPTAVLGVSQLLGRGTDVLPWATARKEFTAALRRVEELRDERQRAHEAFARRGTLTARLSEGRRRVAALEVLDSAHQRAIDQAQADIESLSAERSRVLDVLRACASARPSWFRSMMTLGQASRPWRDQVLQLTEQSTSLWRSIADQQAALSRLSGEQAATRTAISEERQAVRSVEDAIESDEALLARQPDGAPSSDWFHTSEDAREARAPWCDPAFNTARSELFLRAIQLHRSFTFATAKHTRDNLMSVIDVLKNRAPAHVSPAAIRAAWESLFLLIPVLSTTFASLPRMLSSLGRERLGWLIVDEAGQAAPQHALAGVWRVRRCVMVGDPLQLEPVLTLPVAYQECLLELTACDSSWLPRSNPAQVLADRATRFGSTITPPGGAAVDVGSPLRMHRRCNDPMFSVINELVYGGLMMHGGDRAAACSLPDGQAVMRSAWLDIHTARWDDNCSPDEIERLRELLGALRDDGWPMSDILVVSPFRAVSAAIKRMAANFRLDRDTQTGTVHTAQGKEAQIVILVLGGRTPGARDWAVETPNLFNVAVSRAKRRLYVIGDRSEWSRVQYFAELADTLPCVPADVSLTSVAVHHPQDGHSASR